MKNKITVGLGVLGLVAVAGFASTTAFFSDTETSEANAFIAGSLDLQVGVDSETNSFPPQNLNNRTLFQFTDLRPGEMSVGDFILASDSEVWACSAAEITANNENGRTEAENDDNLDATAGEGELAQYIEFATWEDSNDDDKVGTGERGSFEVLPLTTYANGTYYPVRDTDNGGQPIASDENYNLGFAYCYGSFETDGSGNYAFENSQPVCNGASVGNDSQSDSVEGTIYFYAEQSQGNENFQCSDLGDINGDGDGQGGEGNEEPEALYFNGFETDTAGWDENGGALTRVASGTDGVAADNGNFFAQITAEAPYTDWGNPASTFPESGYTTEVDVYLDMAKADGSSTKNFEWDSAINDTFGDFLEEAFFDVRTDPDTAGEWQVSLRQVGPDGFMGQPWVGITDSGWYTFQTHFYEGGDGLLYFELTVRDEDGNVVTTHTYGGYSEYVVDDDAGAPRYGWFSNVDFDVLPIDNTRLYSGSPD